LNRSCTDLMSLRSHYSLTTVGHHNKREGAVSIDDNKQLVRDVIDQIWIKRRIEALPQFFGDDLLEDVTAHTEQFLDAFSDIKVLIEDLIAEGDKVMARLTVSATHSGTFAGQDATGKPISFASFRIYRVANGRVVDTWAMQDRLGLMEQLGLVQSPSSSVEWAAGKGQRDG